MFKSWFTAAPTPQELPEVDANHSLGALLVRMAKADKEYHVAEISTVDKVIGQQFGLNAVDAAKMRAICELLEKAAPDTDEFVALIRANVALSNRKALIAALEDVARADGVEHPEELALISDLKAALCPEA